MKIYSKFSNKEFLINEKLGELANISYNFNKIPPVIGIIVADQFGNTILVIEYDNEQEEKYGPIKSYLSENNKDLFELDLISMYFSSFKAFASQTNIQNLSNLEILGSNIKVQLFFLLERYMIIIFLNSSVYLNLKEKEGMIQYFEEIFNKYEFEFQHFNSSNSRRVLRMLKNKGIIWLKKLNKIYIHTYQNIYLKKHEILEIAIKKITPIIGEVLIEYLESIPEDIMNDIIRELKNKIHDKISEFNFPLD
ncbi:MAG: hypothetical protein ACFE8N_04095 [Promethearchaeota archaeon]